MKLTSKQSLGLYIISVLLFGLLLFTVPSAFTKTVITETISYNIYDYTNNSYMYGDQLMYPVVLGEELMNAGFIKGWDIEQQLKPDDYYFIRQETILQMHYQFRFPWENSLELWDTFKEAKVNYNPK